jgi:hypothetical protein
MAVVPPNVDRPSEFGIRACSVPEISTGIQALLAFIERGKSLRHPDSKVAKNLLAEARSSQELIAPDGKVFAARVGGRSRISVQISTGGKNVWRPVLSAINEGWVIGQTVSPLPEAPEGLTNIQKRRWQFGCAALDIAMLKIDAGESRLANVGARVHLGSAASTLLMLESVDRIPLEELHELSGGTPRV